MNRREFMQATGLGLGTWALVTTGAEAADSAKPVSFVRQRPPMHLGLVTYELAKDWNIATVIRNCEATQFEGVELRTTHAHGVEVSLTAEQRAEVKRRFQDSHVQLMGLGSTFDYHTPDPTKLRRDLEATKQYILLARDVGAGGVKVRPNALPREVPKEKTLEQIGRSLREVGEFGANYGIQIRLEVHGSGTNFVPNIKTILDVAAHPNVGACWNSNDSDLADAGFDANFDLLKGRIFSVHLRDLFLENYPFRRLLGRLNASGFRGFCLAEIPGSQDPLRVMRYYRALWLAYQDAL